jgi:hypothetical protein
MLSLPAAEPVRPIWYPGLDTLAWRLFVAGACLLMLLSPHALLRLGYPYEAPLFGPFPFKIHPGTYVITLALLCALAARGNPLRSAFRVAGREPLLAIHLTAMVFCLIWVIWRHGTSGAAFIVDTHWLPALALLALAHMDDERRAWLLRLLAVFIASNALIALLEAATHSRLTPLYLQGQSSGFAEEEHFRSSALLGHPLANAKVTCMLLPIALLLPMRGLWRWLHAGVVLLSLLAFGSRMGMAVCVLLYGSLAVAMLISAALRGRFSYLQLTGGSVFLLALLAGGVAFVIVTGLGERIFNNLYLDNSASVRLRVWSAYDHVDAQQLIFGISAREIDQVAIKLGLDPRYEAIENGWIYLSLQFGLIVFGIWLIGFGSLYVWLFRQAPLLAGLGVIAFLMNASTTNAFASKSVTQGLMVIYVVAAAAERRRQMAAAQAALAGAAAGAGASYAPAAAAAAAVGPAWYGSATANAQAERPNGRKPGWTPRGAPPFPVMPMDMAPVAGRMPPGPSVR